MNNKRDCCSTVSKLENDGSTLSEDKESLEDSNNDAEKKTVTFYCWGKTERTQKMCKKSKVT